MGAECKARDTRLQREGVPVLRWTSAERVRDLAVFSARNGSRRWLRPLLGIGGRAVDSGNFAAHGAQVCAELPAVVDRVLGG